MKENVGITYDSFETSLKIVPIALLMTELFQSSVNVFFNTMTTWSSRLIPSFTPFDINIVMPIS